MGTRKSNAAAVLAARRALVNAASNVNRAKHRVKHSPSQRANKEYLAALKTLANVVSEHTLPTSSSTKRTSRSSVRLPGTFAAEVERAAHERAVRRYNAAARIQAAFKGYKQRQQLPALRERFYAPGARGMWMARQNFYSRI